MDIFGHLDKQRLSTLSTSMSLIEFDPGHQILVEREKGNSFYVIIKSEK